MINLILDCSCGMNVYVVKDDEVFLKIDSTQNKHSDEILLAIDNLLKDARVKINDVNNICVCVGPGSFTGVRVAISLAKGLSIGIGAKVYVLTNFEIFDIEDRENSCLVLDGFSSYVYARKFKSGKIIDECIDVNQLKSDIEELQMNVFVTSEKTQNLLKKYKINSKIIKNNIINAFKCEIVNNKSTQLNQIFPVYLRASQAEIEREKKLKNG